MEDLWTPSRTPTASFLIPFSHIFWLIYSFFHRFYSHLLFFQRKWREYGCQHKKSPRPFLDTYHWSVWFPFQMKPKKVINKHQLLFLVQELFQTFNQAKEISQMKGIPFSTRGPQVHQQKTAYLKGINLRPQSRTQSHLQSLLPFPGAETSLLRLGRFWLLTVLLPCLKFLKFSVSPDGAWVSRGRG